MATKLITDIPIFVFSSQLREIEFETDLDRLFISIEDGLTEFFRTTIYAYDGKASLINIVEVLENHMIQNGQVVNAFTMYYRKADDTVIDFFSIITIFCSHYTSANGGNVASYNFLSSLPVKRLPRNGIEYITLLHLQDSETLKMHCVFANKDGSIDKVTIPLREVNTVDLGTITFKFHAQNFLNVVKSKYPNAEKLVSYTLEYKNRFSTTYITDEIPTISFTFKNCFNVEETIYLNGVTTTKTKVNRSMAISQGRHSFYDQSVDKTYEVETAPLTQAEAEWVEQLFMSHSVRLGTALDSSTLPKVIITESTCEIDDNDEQLHKVKFTWQFEEQRPHLHAQLKDSDSRIFTEPYNHTFK